MPSFLTLSLLTTATFTGLNLGNSVINNTAESQPCYIERMFSSSSNSFVQNLMDVLDVGIDGLGETTERILSTQIQINEFQKQLEPFKSEILRLIELTNEDENNYNLLIEYIILNENNLFFKLAVIDFFSDVYLDEDKVNFIDIVLSSDIDIFVDWYKSVLEISSKSANCSLSKRANDILHYYSKGFSKV